jgi:hypothetical protein
MTRLYHVTETKRVRKILKEGLRRFMTSNWVRSGDHERYGMGEVYAFEAWQDAVGWAAYMDWHLHKKTSSGKISVVSFDTDIEGWEVDTHDPLHQVGRRGRWLKSQMPVPREALVQVVPVTSEVLRNAVMMKAS